MMIKVWMLVLSLAWAGEQEHMLLGKYEDVDSCLADLAEVQKGLVEPPTHILICVPLPENRNRRWRP